MAYPWKNLTPKDKIEIIFSQFITDSDLQILSLLYKPLIKAQAFSFYITLKNYQFMNYDTIQVLTSRLLRELDMGLADFYQARIKLEALGLLSVYKKEESEYLYRLNPPLSAKSFFQEPLLAVQLKDHVGEDLFNEYKSRYLGPTKKTEDFKNISKTFFDVFQISQEKLAGFQTDLAEESPVTSFDSEKLAKESFDWTVLKQSLGRQLVAHDFLTNEIRQLINVYHLTYGFNELEIRDIILQVADLETGEISYTDLSKKLNQAVFNLGKENQLYSTSSDQGQKEETQTKPVFTEDMANNVVAVAKLLSPYQYLNSIKSQRNGIVSDNEKWLIKNLMDYAKYPPEVINILIHYVLVVQKNPSLNKNYTLTIADSWAQKNVKTAEDAVKIVNNYYSEKAAGQKQAKAKNRGFYSKGKVESTPDWMKKPIQEDKAMDAKEERGIIERLNRLKNEQGES